MHKQGQKETRASNEYLIVQMLLNGSGLSRVELAEKTKLSASTVTTLTADLIRRGVLVESGTKVMTAGRARVELTVNDDLGYLLVLEITHTGFYVTTLKLHLEILDSRHVEGQFFDGNSLFAAVSSEILVLQQTRALAGIGILFQDDLNSGSFRVMYSTGYEAANITLKDALKTQFRVPVLEETCEAFTISDAMHTAGIEERNVAHIQLGASIRTTVRIDGKTIPLREHFAEDFSTICPPKSGTNPGGLPWAGISVLINLLYAMFRLDTVLIARSEPLPKNFLQNLVQSVNPLVTGFKSPHILLVEDANREQIAKNVGNRIRSKTLSKYIGVLG